MVGKIMKKRVFAIGMLLSIMTMATLISKIYASTYTLTVSVNNPDGGTTDPIPADYGFNDYGEGMNVTAIPNGGYWFVGWEFDGEMQEDTNTTIEVIVGFGFHLHPHRYLVAVFEIEGEEYLNWTQTEQNGQWDDFRRTSWNVTKGQFEGNVSYEITIENFTGYYAKIKFSDFNCYIPNWGQWGAEKMFYWTMELKHGTESVLIYIQFKKHIDWWGGLWARNLWASVITNYTDIWTCPSNAIMDDMEMHYLEIYISRNGTFLNFDIVNNKTSYIINGELFEPVLLDFKANVSFTESFYDSVQITQRFNPSPLCLNLCVI